MENGQQYKKERRKVFQLTRMDHTGYEKTLVEKHIDRNNCLESQYKTRVMSSNFCPHLIFKFGDLIEFLCLRIDLIKICDYWIY